MEKPDYQLTRIVEWSKEKGANIDPNLEFHFSDDRGIYATYKKTLSSPSETPQLEIPTDLILTNQLSNTYFGKEFDTDNVNASLKLFLAKLKYDSDWVQHDGEEVNHQKFFAPYVDLLPTGEATGSVFYWSAKEIELLENTNLGGSLNLKLGSLVNEWKDAIVALPENFQSDLTKNDLQFFERFHEHDHEQLRKELLDVKTWTSFGAYLWSSTIFTSRAFPNHIINPNVKDGQAILLPVLDLLNHDNATKINWNHTIRGNKEYFALHNLELLQEGAEVFNNYGAKGNEELLMGYGFVIDGNSNDSVALRVKIPFESIKEAQDYGVKIPKIDDYTYHAFQTKAERSSDDYITEEETKNGLLYFINRTNLIPDNLLSLFQFLVKKGAQEPRPTLRSKLQALQNLRQALDQKEKLLKKEPVIDTADINPTRLHNALVYRKGQQEIYKLASSEIKSTEKNMLKEYKSYVLNLKKLYKKDKKLQDLLSAHLNIADYDTIESEDMIDAVYFLWLIMHGEGLSGEEYTAPDWIIQEYRSFKDTGVVTNGELKNLEEFLQQYFIGTDVLPFLTEKNLTLANQILNQSSYIRTNTNEIILVEPLNL